MRSQTREFGVILVTPFNWLLHYGFTYGTIQKMMLLHHISLRWKSAEFMKGVENLKNGTWKVNFDFTMPKNEKILIWSRSNVSHISILCILNSIDAKRDNTDLLLVQLKELTHNYGVTNCLYVSFSLCNKLLRMMW